MGRNNEEQLNIEYKEKADMRRRRRNIVRIVAACAVVVSVVWLIFGFLTAPSDSKPENLGELMERCPEITEKNVALTVDGMKISDNIWQYMFMQNVKGYASGVGEEVKDIDWNADKDGEPLIDYIKYNTVKEIAKTASVISFADEQKIVLSEEDLRTMTELDGIKQLYGDKAYEELAIADEKSFEEIRRIVLLEEKVRKTVSEDISKFCGDKNPEAYADDQSVTVQTIEIPKEYDELARMHIEEIAERLKKGENFYALRNEIYEELSKKQNSVDFEQKSLNIYKDSLAKPYKNMENVGLGLKIGEISGIVETDYSYVILKRTAGYTEFVNMISEKCEIKLNKEIIGKTGIQ